MIALITALTVLAADVPASFEDSAGVYAADTVVAEGCAQRIIRYSCADSLGNESCLWATDTEYLPVLRPGAYEPCPLSLHDANGEDVAVDLTITGDEPRFVELPGGDCGLQFTRGVALTADGRRFAVCSYFYEYAVEADGRIWMTSARPLPSDLDDLMSRYSVFIADGDDDESPLDRGQILSRLSRLLPARQSEPMDPMSAAGQE